MEVKKCINPTNEEIDELHQKFIEALTDLFETHKTKYIEKSEDFKLNII